MASTVGPLSIRWEVDEDEVDRKTRVPLQKTRERECLFARKEWVNEGDVQSVTLVWMYAEEKRKERPS